jgi:hypothetical protein
MALLVSKLFSLPPIFCDERNRNMDEIVPRHPTHDCPAAGKACSRAKCSSQAFQESLSDGFEKR